MGEFEQKHSVTRTIASGNAPFSQLVDCSDKRRLSIQLIYGAGTSTTAKLQVSNNGVNFSDYPDSTQVLSNGGGSHVWAVFNFEHKYLKAVVTGDAVSCSLVLTSDK